MNNRYKKSPKSPSWSLGQGVLMLKNAHDMYTSKQALFRAVHAGDTSLIESLITAGSDVNERKHESRETLLIIAAKYGQVSMIDKLLALGAEPNFVDSLGRTALMVASHQGELPTVRAILTSNRTIQVDKRNLSGNTALMQATSACSSTNYLLSMQALIEAGADVNAANNMGLTPLMLCTRHVKFGVQAIQLLLDAGAKLNEVDTSGETALHQAARLGKLEIVQFLLDAAPETVILANYNGNTPLVDALRNGHCEVVKELLKAGADPNSVSGRGVRVLNIASTQNAEMVKILLNAGARPVCNVQHPEDVADGESPLIEAAAAGNFAVVELLLQAGADPNTTRGGTHVLNIAASTSLESVRLLLKAGSCTVKSKPYVNEALLVTMATWPEKESLSECESIFLPTDIAVLNANFITAFFLMTWIGCHPTYQKNMHAVSCYGKTKRLMRLAHAQSNLDPRWANLTCLLTATPPTLTILCERFVSCLVGKGEGRRQRLVDCGLPPRIVKQIMLENVTESLVTTVFCNTLETT